MGIFKRKLAMFGLLIKKPETVKRFHSIKRVFPLDDFPSIIIKMARNSENATSRNKLVQTKYLGILWIVENNNRNFKISRNYKYWGFNNIPMIWLSVEKIMIPKNKKRAIV